MIAQLQMPVPSPLRHQVVDILRNAITSCMFEPGGRLTERALCEQLGVSRSTVREGLCQLEAEGLVRITPHRGPVVTVLSETEAAEIYAIRVILEGEASAAAAAHADAATCKILETQLARMQVALAAADFNGLQREKTLFYAALYAATGNRQLELLLKQMRARVTLVRGLDVDRGPRMDASVRGAREIAAAVRDRDPDAARSASRGHIARAAELALRAMRTHVVPVPAK
jgi:GntR family transcriptional regulator, trigonelline degradation regulator